MIHFHKWSKWSLPFTTRNSGHKQQWRFCETCGKTSFRTHRWDFQTSIHTIREALIALGFPTKEKA